MDHGDIPMISPAGLYRYTARFHAVVDEAALSCPAGRDALELKRRHSLRVLQEAEGLTKALGLAPRTAFLIHLAALFHDLGRFAQVRQFNTFDDHRSFNHARESVRILRRLDLLGDLPAKERRLVTGAIFLHNRPTLPRLSNPGLDLAARVLRDADKLDIVALILSFLEGAKAPDTGIYLHLRDDPRRFSPELLDLVLAGRVFRIDAARYVNDFLLLMCAWIYDLNCEAARAAFRARGYIRRVFEHLPPDPRLEAAADRLTRDLCARPAQRAPQAPPVQGPKNGAATTAHGQNRQAGP